jgi:hypothetical protein
MAMLRKIHLFVILVIISVSLTGFISIKTSSHGNDKGGNKNTVNSGQVPLIEPTFTWNTFMGSMDYDRPIGIAVDVSGNVYIVGLSHATWGNPVRPFGSGIYHAFAAKLNSNGTLMWNTFLGSVGSDYADGIAVDASGNIYVTGYSSATWGAPLNPFAGGGDVFVAKLNNAGALIWNTFLGSADYDHEGGIAVDVGGYVYVTGSSYATWGTPVNAFTGRADVFTVKLSSSGARQWNTFMGSTGGYDEARGIAVDESGKVYVTGQSNATWGTPVNSYTGGNNVFAAMLSTNGVRQWHTFMGSASGNDSNSITVDGIGNVYITGYSAATWGTPVNPFTGGLDAFATKLNNSGARLWNTFIGSVNTDYGNGIAIDGIGNVYLTGQSNETWGQSTIPFVGGIDAFTAILDTNGVRQWNNFMGSAAIDVGEAITLDRDGNIYITGMSNASWGMPMNAYSGDYDVFLAKIEAIDSTDVALVGKIDAGNRQPPFEPNHVTLGIDVKNNSADVVQNVQVDFFDGNPDLGGVNIDTVNVGNLDPGAQIPVYGEWNLIGNIEAHQVFARALVSGSVNDADPGNNTISSPISVYYVDFRHDRDAYIFSNEDVGKVTTSEIIGYLSKFHIPEMTWLDLIPFFGVLTEINGHCYGMSNSSLIYFENPDINPVDSIYNDLTLAQALENIRTYQWYVIGPTLDIWMGRMNSNTAEQYQQTLESIRSGDAVIHILIERHGLQISEGSHAVVAYKIIDLGDKKKVFYYDNNLPLNRFPSAQAETYGVFDESGFSDPYHSTREKPYFYNEAYVLEPQIYETGHLLWDFIRWIFQFHMQGQSQSVTATGLVDLLVVDGQGRRAGYISGQEVNEIPGATVTKVIGSQALILPNAGIYQISLTGVTASAQIKQSSAMEEGISISIFDPISNMEARRTSFQQIILAANEAGTIQFQHGQGETEINLPGGVSLPADVEVIVPPDYSVYIPLVKR